jgi:hypothetical protein
MQKNTLNKLILFVTLGLFALNFSPVLAQTMEIEVIGGGYRLRGPDTITFNPVPASFTVTQSVKDIRALDIQNEEDIATATQARDFISVEDRNGGNPFQVTIVASDFTPAGITAADIEVKNANGVGQFSVCELPNPQWGCNQAAITGNAATDNFASLDTQRVLVDGDGLAPTAWRFFPVFRINVPAETVPGVYTSTLTFTVI